MWGVCVCGQQHVWAHSSISVSGRCVRPLLALMELHVWVEDACAQEWSSTCASGQRLCSHAKLHSHEWTVYMHEVPFTQMELHMWAHMPSSQASFVLMNGSLHTCTWLPLIQVEVHACMHACRTAQFQTGCSLVVGHNPLIPAVEQLLVKRGDFSLQNLSRKRALTPMWEVI